MKARLQRHRGTRLENAQGLGMQRTNREGGRGEGGLQDRGKHTHIYIYMEKGTRKEGI